MRQRVDVGAPLVWPRSRVNAVNEKHWRTVAVLGERDSPVTPIEAPLVSANQIGELVDALASKGIVGGRYAKQCATGQEDFSPGWFAFVVVLHHASFRSVKKKRGYLRVTALSELRTGAGKSTALTASWSLRACVPPISTGLSSGCWLPAAPRICDPPSGRRISACYAFCRQPSVRSSGGQPPSFWQIFWLLAGQLSLPPSFSRRPLIWMDWLVLRLA